MSSAFIIEKQTLTGVISEDQKLDSTFIPSVGPKGDDGMSAFEIALKNGYVGTETEWLASLKGDSGPAGPQGIPGEKGEQGNTPVKGVDYWNEEDISEIQSYINTQLGVIENGSY